MAVDPSGNTKISCRFCMYLCRYRKGILSVIWLGFFVALIVNISSSLLLTKKIDLNGTLLSTFLSNLWILATLGLILLSITIFFGLVCPLLEQRNKQYSEQHLVSPEEAMQNRERLLPLLQTIYTRQLLPLQRAARIHLEIKQRIDMTFQPLKLIWLTSDNIEPSIAPDTSITEIYKQAGNGLLILGAAGAGKSTLLVDLAENLLQQAQQNPKLPFPVVLNLSSWAKTQQPLEQWLTEELLLQYRVPRRLTATWINTDQLFLLLDGLDEVKDSARAACIDAINYYLHHHLLPLVVCCRSEAYRHQEHLIALQSAIEIQPLDKHEVTNYFSATPFGKLINTALRQNKVLQELLTTPLMVQIMLLAYQGKSAKDLPRRGSREEQQHYLFESYVKQMLNFQATQQKPMPEQTLSWLLWLARQMAQHTQSDFYLERLDMSWLPQKHLWMYRLGIGILSGLLSGLLIGLLSGLAGGLVDGLVGGLVFGLTIGLVVWAVWGKYDTNKPVETLNWNWKRVLRSFRNGLVGGLFFGLIIGLTNGLVGGLLFGLLSMWIIGLIGGMINGISRGQIEEHARVIPNQGILRSGQNALLVGLFCGLVGGLVIGLFCGLVVWFLPRFQNGLVMGLHNGLLTVLLFGLFDGLFFGLLLGIFNGMLFGGIVYFNHYTIRLWLWHFKYLPWNYEKFLDAAAECILLQKVGGGYRFIHQEFLIYFASLDTTSLTHKANPQAP